MASTAQRTYHSPYRQAAAERTRRAIVAAALRLHARGVGELSAVAAEAGVALPTLYRHFGSREALLAACAPEVSAPLTALLTHVSVSHRRDARLLRAVRGLYALYERHGERLWAAWSLRSGSPGMEAAAARVEEAVTAIAAAVVNRRAGEPSGHERALCGLLSPLAHRALRGAGLTPEQATLQAVAMATTTLGPSGAG